MGAGISLAWVMAFTRLQLAFDIWERDKEFPTATDSKRFRLVSEQRKTEERDSRFWPREKWNKSQKMKVGGGGGGGEGRNINAVHVLLGSHTRPPKFISAPLKAKHFISQLWQLMTASNVGARTQAWQAKWMVFKIPGIVCKRFLPFFPTPSPLFYLRYFSSCLWYRTPVPPRPPPPLN